MLKGDCHMFIAYQLPRIYPALSSQLFYDSGNELNRLLFINLLLGGWKGLKVI